MPSLLATNQGEGKIVRDFIERFLELSIRCPHGMTQEILVETCRHNLLIDVLVNKGLIESKSWRDLFKQFEKVEDIIRHLKEQRSVRRGTTNIAPPHSSHSKWKDTMAMEIMPKPKRAPVKNSLARPSIPQK